MSTLGDLIQRPEPVSPGCPCATAMARFLGDPKLVLLPVVTDGRPVGALSRPAFMARMETPGAADRPAAEVMDPAPTITAAADRPRDVIRRLMHRTPAALLCGFVVVDGSGLYQGVATALDLLASRMGRPSRGALSTPLAARFADAVREPVASAMAAVRRLRETGLPARADGDLETIAEAGGEVLRLLESAGELRRAKHRGLVFAPESCRLAELMDEIETRWRRAAERRGLAFMVSYDGQPDACVEIDRARVLQVFDALIAHALAHARQGVVEASLKARAEDGDVVLDCRVRDSGSRHERAYLETMFDEGGPQSHAGDLGLRLSLALGAHIVSTMGGALTACPNAGPGITKLFEVAVAAAKPAEAAAPSAAAPAQRLAHVLVVEDNATNRMVIETLCEMLGCTSESVVDGVEAVEAAQAGRFDVILMDIKMPRMDGLTATAEIRKLPGHAGATPIVALTANADPDDVRRY
ncbi:MAG TPA: response regulator, partial [Caulobacteraceae bacterium]|nr:response regulator [Caulobacteraceae bacterium]